MIKLILIIFLINFSLLNALDCNWMSCYDSELKNCETISNKEQCKIGVFVIYKEAPLFLSKQKCCKWPLSLELIDKRFLYCVKSIQNATLFCKSKEDSDIEIITKNGCNRFGCKKIDKFEIKNKNNKKSKEKENNDDQVKENNNDDQIKENNDDQVKENNDDQVKENNHDQVNKLQTISSNDNIELSSTEITTESNELF